MPYSSPVLTSFFDFAFSAFHWPPPVPVFTWLENVHVVKATNGAGRAGYEEAC